MKFVYLVPQGSYKKLRIVLGLDRDPQAAESNAFARDSFAFSGYVLKESKAVELAGGNYVVFFSNEDEQVSKSLCKQLEALEGVKRLEGGEAEGVISRIEEEQNQAASGFGNIFG